MYLCDHTRHDDSPDEEDDWVGAKARTLDAMDGSVHGQQRHHIRLNARFSTSQHGSAWASMGQHKSAWVIMGQHGSARAWYAPPDISPFGTIFFYFMK